MSRKGNILTALSTILLLLVILICLPLMGPRLLGYQPFAIITGSMEPEIPVGSIVYAKAASPQELAPGDVIVFYGGRGQDTVITHRIAENDAAESQFITKGDANEQNDMEPVPYGNLIGEVRFSLPVLGRFLPLAAGTSGKMILLGILAAALALNILGRGKTEEA